MHLGCFTLKIHDTRKVNKSVCQELLKVVQPRGTFSAVYRKDNKVVKNEVFLSNVSIQKKIGQRQLL